MSASAGLNAAQNRALAVLLAGGTHEDAATSARKSVRTVRRWLRNDDRFRSELSERSRQILRDATERLQQGSDNAAAALVAMAAGEVQASAARVAAAAKVIELGRHNGELEELRDAVAVLRDRLNVRGGVQ